MINDPFAGSPTKTLLRLLLPLNDKVYTTSPIVFGFPLETTSPECSPDHSSVEATGGVYKGQGRIQCKLMTHIYKEFLVCDQKLQ